MLDECLLLTPGEFKEWSDPKDLEFFSYIKSYSPYDNTNSFKIIQVYLLHQDFLIPE